MALSTRIVIGNVVDIFPKRVVGEKNSSVINFKLAVSRREKNAETGEWGDSEAEFIMCTAWNRLADNIEKSFNKGDKMIAYGNYFMEKPRKNEKTGDMYPAEGRLTVEYAGHEVSFIPAHSEREATSQTTGQQNGGGGAAPAQASVPRRTQTPAAAPAAEAPAAEEQAGPKDLFASKDGDSDDWDF